MPNFTYKQSNSLESMNKNSLVVFTADARNLTYPNNISELKSHEGNIQYFYKSRKEVSPGIPVSSEETSPRLGQVLYKHFDNIYAMCVTIFFEKPEETNERQNLIKLMYSDELLGSEGIKFSIRNDKTSIRDFYFMVCLERILKECEITNISDVQVIWPYAQSETNSRIKYMINLLTQFAFALWQSKVSCTIIGQSEINYKEKDALMAALKVLEAKASTIEMFNFDPKIVQESQEKDPVLGAILNDMKQHSLQSKDQYQIVKNILHTSEFSEIRGFV